MVLHNTTYRPADLGRMVLLAAMLIAATGSGNAHAEVQASYSPALRQPHPTNVYWGDTHLHTNMSGDAVFRLGPDAAYRFARGEEVTTTTGQQAKINRPLDFLVIADHANNMGAQLAREWGKIDPEFRKTQMYKLWEKARDQLLNTPGVDTERLLKGSLWPGDLKDVAIRHPEFRKTVWQRVTAAADRENTPGLFTAFIGYEWTSSKGAIHRVVVFKDDAAHANQVLPFSAWDSLKPEDLWSYMEGYERATGGSVLAIPHNSNISYVMFGLLDSEGKPLTQEYARNRSRWEPLVEATQIKGDSETHPFLSPNDEFADFETWNTWGGRINGAPYQGRSYTRPDNLIPYQYARSALKLGLQQKAKLGANPFKFGMIGSTDSHTALAAVDENNFWGKTMVAEPSERRMFGSSAIINWEMNAAGYAAVWAEENTREAIFSAMRRKEVYSSTGPRIAVRFFGGWDYDDDDALRHDLAAIGYAKGVPMGGDLTGAPDGKPPRFLIRAVKDPLGANLDRVQVVKGWHDEKGDLHESVYDVALSDGRTVGASGRAEPVGNTVDVENATYTNSIGDPELAIVWTDPDFDKDELAFYYVRVLEIPTPRWTAYDAKFYGIKDLPTNIQTTIQERAYTSPIWYNPE